MTEHRNARDANDTADTETPVEHADDKDFDTRRECISEDCDIRYNGYGITRTIRAPSGLIIRILVFKSRHHALSSHADASIRVDDTWMVLHGYPALEWALPIPNLPEDALDPTKPPNDNTWSAAQTRTFIRDALLSVVDEVERRARRILVEEYSTNLVIGETPGHVVATYGSAERAQEVADQVNSIVGQSTVRVEPPVPYEPSAQDLLERLSQYT